MNKKICKESKKLELWKKNDEIIIIEKLLKKMESNEEKIKVTCEAPEKGSADSFNNTSVFFKISEKVSPRCREKYEENNQCFIIQRSSQ